MLFPSGLRPRQESRIAPFPVIGKAILIGGTKNSHIATLVERHVAFLTCPGPGAKQRQRPTVVAALSRQIRSFPPRAALVDLGSRAGDGAAQSFTNEGHRCESVLRLIAHSPGSENDETNQPLTGHIPAEENRTSGYTHSSTDKLALRLNQRPENNFGLPDSS